MKNIKLTLVTTAMLLSGQVLFAADAGEVAKKANPVAAMISLPIQVNYQTNMGADDEGSQWLTNVQPVMPFVVK